jgi:hypothetical protein
MLGNSNSSNSNINSSGGGSGSISSISSSGGGSGSISSKSNSSSSSRYEKDTPSSLSPSSSPDALTSIRRPSKLPPLSLPHARVEESNLLKLRKEEVEEEDVFSDEDVFDASKMMYQPSSLASSKASIHKTLHDFRNTASSNIIIHNNGSDGYIMHSSLSASPRGTLPPPPKPPISSLEKDLLYASQLGDVEEVARLIFNKGVDPNCKDNSVSTYV